MKIFFLGTNGWFDTHTGNTTSTLIEVKDAYIILDAGGGIYRACDMVKENKPVYLLLSHLHMDHISGLQILPLFKRAGSITIITPDGMKKELENIMRLLFMPPPKHLKTKTEIIEFSKTKKLPFKIKALPLEHIVPTFGYRIEADSKSVAYASDSGVCENILSLAKNADLLIAECSYLPDRSADNNHFNPQQAAALAAQADASVLALIHFKADVYKDFQTRDDALIAAGKIFPHTIAPYDGDCIKI
ncbi:MAG: ribonuclease Z [Elusimicrobiota bacterium]|jgi:ribonuclease BN (tRNA processing enzyme)|nr:ribonuclease Z [Elusimicrobiota bacterium]